MLTDLNRRIVVRSPLPANDRYLAILKAGTVVKVPGVAGWRLHVARVESDPGPLENAGRRVSLARVYFGQDGKEVPESSPARIEVRRDRVSVWPSPGQ